jgi:hypothetical protein
VSFLALATARAPSSDGFSISGTWCFRLLGSFWPSIAGICSFHVADNAGVADDAKEGGFNTPKDHEEFAVLRRNGHGQFTLAS